MKTFIVLFVIAISLPTEAQRVKENVRQRIEIVEDNGPIEQMQDDSDKKPDKKSDLKDSIQKKVDSMRKQ